MCRLEYCGQKNKKYSFEYFLFIRARDGTRTRGPDLGKVVLHQLSHSRICKLFCICLPDTFDIILWETGFVNKFFEKVIMKAENHAFWRKNHFLI